MNHPAIGDTPYGTTEIPKYPSNGWLFPQILDGSWMDSPSNGW